MDILGILKGLLAAITAVIVSWTGAPAPSPAAVQALATSTEAVVQETAAQASTTDQGDQIRQAYELGRAMGRLESAVTATTSPISTTSPSTPMNQDNNTGTTSSPAPDLSSSSGGSTAGTPAPQVTAPASQARIEVISPIAGKGLGRTYKAAEQVADESNYMVIGAVVYDDAGQPMDTPTVTITATDDTQNKTLVGTGDLAIVYVNGQKTRIPVYTYEYDFKTAGDHIITFSANGLTQAVTVEVQ